MARVRHARVTHLVERLLHIIDRFSTHKPDCKISRRSGKCTCGYEQAVACVNAATEPMGISISMKGS